MSARKVDVKVVLLGKEFGGKTSLIERYLHSRFSEDTPYQNTIGAAYGAKTVHVFGRDLTLGIFDTAGSERYQAMSRIYYRDAWAAVLCFDLTDPSSLERAKFWREELMCNEPECHVYYVGTKRDLVETDARVAELYPGYMQQVEYWASSCDPERSPAIFETSAKTGENVSEIFDRIARDFVKETREKGPPGRKDDQKLSLHAKTSRHRNEGRRHQCNC